MTPFFRGPLFAGHNWICAYLLHGFKPRHSSYLSFLYMACKNVLKTFKSVFITKNVTRKCAETLVNFATRLFFASYFSCRYFWDIICFPGHVKCSSYWIWITVWISSEAINNILALIDTYLQSQKPEKLNVFRIVIPTIVFVFFPELIQWRVREVTRFCQDGSVAWRQQQDRRR